MSSTQKTRRSARVDLNDEVFGGRVKTDLIHESVVRAERGRTPRHARDQDPRAGQRQRQEAVAAEGHRPRARRRNPQPAVAPRRHRVRPAAAQLRILAPEEGREGRAARRPDAEAAGRLGDRHRRADRVGSEDQGRRRRAEDDRRDRQGLLVDVALDEKFAMSVRNIAGVSLVQSNRVTARDVANTAQVVLTQAARRKAGGRARLAPGAGR